MLNYQIDVSSITDYNCDNHKLELLIIFWVLAAGKNGKISANNLNKLLTFLQKEYGDLSPFILLKKARNLPLLMKECGIGCFNIKANTITNLINSDIDLRNCSCYDLEKIKGIGRKTSRAFIVHSRKDAKYAVIDRHVLSYLASLGHELPQIISNEVAYKKVEEIFLSVLPVNFTVAEFDLLIWRIYSGN